MTRLYALLDPRRPAEIRYIGKTIHPLGKRLARHVYEAKTGKPSHRVHWLRKMLSEGVRPVCELLDEVSGSGAVEERQMIAFCRMMGCRLTNNTDGGEGIVGHKFSPEAKAKIAAATKARMADPAARALLAESVREAWKDPEKRAHMMYRKSRKLPSSQRF